MIPAEILNDAYNLPWRLFSLSDLPVALLVDDVEVLDGYDEKAAGAWDEIIGYMGEGCDPVQAQLTTTSFLALRIFSPHPGYRDEAMRAAFEACWRPEYRAAIMAAGDSEVLWNQTCSDYRQAAKQGDNTAAAMVHMLDELTKAGGRLRMAMAGEIPGIPWEDILWAAGAPAGHEADDMLHDFTEQGFAKWIGDMPHVLITALIWAVPKVVMQLSPRPEEKAALVEAGSRIFSSILDTNPEAWDKLGEVVKSVVEEEGPGAILEAEADRLRILGPSHPGEPALKVTEGDDGEVKVERVRRPVN